MVIVLQLLAGMSILPGGRYSVSQTTYKEEMNAEFKSVSRLSLRNTVFRNIRGIMMKYTIVLGKIP